MSSQRDLRLEWRWIQRMQKKQLNDMVAKEMNELNILLSEQKNLRIEVNYCVRDHVYWMIWEPMFGAR